VSPHSWAFKHEEEDGGGDRDNNNNNNNKSGRRRSSNGKTRAHCTILHRKLQKLAEPSDDIERDSSTHAFVVFRHYYYYYYYYYILCSTRLYIILLLCTSNRRYYYYYYDKSSLSTERTRCVRVCARQHRLAHDVRNVCTA